MVEHPIITRDSGVDTYKIREEEPSKFIGPPSLAFHNFKNERLRIEVKLGRFDMTLGNLTEK